MTVAMVFNDLCLRTPAPDRATARQWMAEFVNTLITAIDHNLHIFRMHIDFANIVLSPEYPLRAWFNDPAVSREAQDFVLSYATRHPYIVPYEADLDVNDKIVIRSGSFEGRYEGVVALGLGYAHLLNGLSLSILTESCWDATFIELNCLELHPETNELLVEQVTVKHASRALHITDHHKAWIAERVHTSVHDGQGLWEKVTLWFPNLVFCDNSRRQIQALQNASLQLPRIVERLFELERYCRNWTEGGFDGGQLRNTSPESQQTLHRYAQQREFVCPDGSIRLFNWHLKGLPNAWRIHIWPDEKNRKILIGYIGSHLSTVSDPT